MNDYYTYVPELGEAQYEAEQAMLETNFSDDNGDDAFDWEAGDDCDNRDNGDAAFDYLNDWCYGDNSTAEENAAMARAEARHDPARQAHLMGAW